MQQGETTSLSALTSGTRLLGDRARGPCGPVSPPTLIRHEAIESNGRMAEHEWAASHSEWKMDQHGELDARPSTLRGTAGGGRDTPRHREPQKQPWAPDATTVFLVFHSLAENPADRSRFTEADGMSRNGSRLSCMFMLFTRKGDCGQMGWRGAVWSR